MVCTLLLVRPSQHQSHTGYIKTQLLHTNEESLGKFCIDPLDHHLVDAMAWKWQVTINQKLCNTHTTETVYVFVELHDFMIILFKITKADPIHNVHIPSRCLDQLRLE